jgi:TolB-like protein
MFTDIQDYTSMMQKGGETVSRMKEKHHILFESITQKYKGKILQYYGGGTLSIFDSAINAVQCAIDMQLALAQDPKIPVRIGIHSGDIIYSQKEVIGDGVNVASRIESLAVSGSIFISGKVYDEIKNQKSIQTLLMGSFKLKNIDRPVKVYAICNEGLVIPSQDQIRAEKIKSDEIEQEARSGLLKIHPKNVAILSVFALLLLVGGFFILRKGYLEEVEDLEKSIAVLPIINLSEDPDQEYFSDGTTEDIITQLSKIGDLKVISRTSIMRYKNTTKTTKQIAEELGVAHILEGSVRKYEEKVRISLQLIDAKTDNHLWAEYFDREMNDIFSIQRDVALEVANELKTRLTSIEEEEIRKYPTDNPEAYEFYLQGVYQLRSGTTEGLHKSFPLLRQAITIDPNFAEAYAEIAAYYIRQGAWRGDFTPEVGRNEAMPYIQKALELNPNLNSARNSLATVKFWFDWDFPGAEMEYKKCQCPKDYGFFLNLMGRFEEAREKFAESYALDPYDVHDRPHRGVNQYFLNNPNEAIKILRDGIRMHPSVITGYHKLGKIYLNIGNYRKAIEMLQMGMEVGKVRLPGILGELAVAQFNIGKKIQTDQIIEELKIEAARSPQRSPAYFIAQIYAGIGNKELAIEWLGKAYEAHEVEMIWLKIEPQFKKLHNDPRYQDLLKRVGFPD